MIATALTAALLAASPPQRGALVFMQVESPAEKDARPFLEESLRQAFSSHLSIITCMEAIQDETALKKILEERDIRSSADAPKKVSLLTNFARYGCEIPEEGDLWAVWLTAYTDSRSSRREVSLRMRNLRDPASNPTFVSLAEPVDTRLSWSELVERCVRRYFNEEEHSQVQIAPVARVRVRDPLALLARISLSQGQEPQGVEVGWRLYRCFEGAACDQFHATVEEYVTCRRTNRARSASDPMLRPQCVDPRDVYDRVAVTSLDGPSSPPWVRWSREPVRTLAIDIPGEYVLLASSSEEIVDGQRLTVEPPFNAIVALWGLAYNPTDTFLFVGYERVLGQLPAGVIGVGLEWNVRLGGTDGKPPPPFGLRGLVAPSLRVRHFFTAEFAGESWLAPVGLLYEFKRDTGYNLHVGSMLGLAAVWNPPWLAFVRLRAGLSVVARSALPHTAELYAPLLGASAEF